MPAHGATLSDPNDLTHLVEDHKIEQEDIPLDPPPARKPQGPQTLPSWFPKLKKPWLFDCGICLETCFVQPKKLKCGPKFCFDCIGEWGKRSHTCPLCRSAFQKPVEQSKANLPPLATTAQEMMPSSSIEGDLEDSIDDVAEGEEEEEGGSFLAVVEET